MHGMVWKKIQDAWFSKVCHWSKSCIQSGEKDLETLTRLKCAFISGKLKMLTFTDLNTNIHSFLSFSRIPLKTLNHLISEQNLAESSSLCMPNVCVCTRVCMCTVNQVYEKVLVFYVYLWLFHSPSRPTITGLRARSTTVWAGTGLWPISRFWFLFLPPTTSLWRCWRRCRNWWFRFLKTIFSSSFWEWTTLAWPFGSTAENPIRKHLLHNTATYNMTRSICTPYIINKHYVHVLLIHNNRYTCIKAD